MTGRAEEIFATLHPGILELHRLREAVRDRMLALPGQFNAAIGRSRLRLRPWRRHGSRRPYAIYWVLIAPDPAFLEGPRWVRLRKPRWPFRRLSVRTSRDLDSAIHFGYVDRHRRLVRSFHERVVALNAAHTRISRTIDTLRKLLCGKQVGQGWPLDAPSPLHLQAFSYPPEVFTVLATLWRLSTWIADMEDHAADAVAVANRVYPFRLLRLRYGRDADHPHGRIAWQLPHSGLVADPSRDELRRLRLTAVEITDFRQACASVREDRRQLAFFGKFLRGFRLRIAAALREVPRILARADFSLAEPAGGEPEEEERVSEFPEEERPYRRVDS